jgi:hypothetical protein
VIARTDKCPGVTSWPFISQSTDGYSGKELTGLILASIGPCQLGAAAERELKILVSQSLEKF